MFMMCTLSNLFPLGLLMSRTGPYSNDLWCGSDLTEPYFSCFLSFWTHVKTKKRRSCNPLNLKWIMAIFSVTGVILRDSHGVAQVRFVTGNKILRILKSKGLAPDLPEDLYHLIKKAVAVRKHLERNRKVLSEPMHTFKSNVFLL